MMMILDGNTVFHAATAFDLHLPVVCAILCGLLVLSCVEIKSSILSVKSLAIALGIVTYYGIYYVVQQNNIIKEDFLFTFTFGVPLLFIYFCVMQKQNETSRIFHTIESIVLLIAASSTIIWYMGCVLGTLQYNCSIDLFWGTQQRVQGFYNIVYVMTTDKTFGLNIIQNNAFFTEAPMLNLWLDIAIATELFLKPKYSKTKLAVLFACLMTTISTTAYIFVFIAVMLKYIEKTINKKSRNIIIRLIIFTAIVPIAYTVVDTILTIKSSTQSYAIRMKNYLVAVKLFMDYPLWGSGYGRMSIFNMAQYKMTKRNLGYTNSVGAVLGTGGVWMTVPYVLSIFGPFIKKYDSKVATICFMICYLYLAITTIFYSRFVQALFIAYGLSFFMLSSEKKHIKTLKVRAL